MSDDKFSNSYCDSQFAKIGLRFWTDDSGGTEPLDVHTAASLGDVEYIKTLPSEDYDRPNLGSWTPLMYSSYLGHRKLTHFLISQNCDVCRDNNEGRTPIMLGAMTGNVGVVKVISNVGQKKVLLQRDKRNFSALSHAVFGGHLDLAEYLISSGSDPNITESQKGYSLLMLAASQGNADMVEILLEGGADISFKTPSDENVLSIAQSLSHDNIVTLIRKFGYRNMEATSVIDGPARAQLLLEQKMLSQRVNMNIDIFLERIGLTQYAKMFKEQEVDFPLLLSLNDDDLKKLGIVLLGPRRKLTSAIAKWKLTHGPYMPVANGSF